jgi:hypothetical protein
MILVRSAHLHDFSNCGGPEPRELAERHKHLTPI